MPVAGTVAEIARKIETSRRREHVTVNDEIGGRRAPALLSLRSRGSPGGCSPCSSLGDHCPPEAAAMPQQRGEAATVPRIGGSASSPSQTWEVNDGNGDAGRAGDNSKRFVTGPLALGRKVARPSGSRRVNCVRRASDQSIRLSGVGRRRDRDPKRAVPWTVRVVKLTIRPIETGSGSYSDGLLVLMVTVPLHASISVVSAACAVDRLTTSRPRQPI
jgi:hypothetical protein